MFRVLLKLFLGAALIRAGIGSGGGPLWLSAAAVLAGAGLLLAATLPLLETAGRVAIAWRFSRNPSGPRKPPA